MLLGLTIFIAAHLIWAAQPILACSPSHQPLKKPDGHVAASWYAAWHAENVTPEMINWTQYNMIFYSFAVTTANSSVIGLQESDVKLLPEFVKAAHDHSVIAMLSIGGWTGSRYFSSAVATDANRTAFAEAIVDVVSEYQLDGIEFDWEYPNNQGIGCNVVSKSDSANFLSFLQMLRKLAPDLIITAAASLKPFHGEDSKPMTDVSEFAKVLDYVEVMNYDVFGLFSLTVGPNSPLNDSCAPPAYQQGSAVSAVQAWSGAGFPPHQIILGVASYGHSYHVNRSEALDASGGLKLFPDFNKTDHPSGDAWDSTAGGVDECGNPNVVGGIFNFWGLIVGGFLKDNGAPSCEVHHNFDNCSQTPFVYNATSEVMVSYDNARSFAKKGAFIREFNLAGFSMFELAGDYENILIKSIRKAIGMDP